MDIKPIRSDEDYRAVIEEIDRLWGSETGTLEGDKLSVLIVLAEDYEKKNFEIEQEDPIETIIFYMDSMGLTRADLEPFIGTRARVSEILNRKRPLSLRMIRNLEQGLGIPANILIQPYELNISEGEFNLINANWELHFGPSYNRVIIIDTQIDASSPVDKFPFFFTPEAYQYESYKRNPQRS